MSAELNETDKNVERYKVKKLIKSLEAARGIGTSVITLYIPPKEQLAKVVGMLNIELGTCSNIKSASNRNSVQGAITSTLGRLKLVNRVPPNGLIIYSGTVLTEDNKEKKLTMDIEPFKPVSHSLYMCDNHFHTDELHKMLESDDKFGFIVVDGCGAMYATLSGSVKTTLASFSVELPKKHGRGGQSKNRFARIRQERRHNYVRKVAELATQLFITNDRPNVIGLVLAGNAEFKETLNQSDLFDPRLRAIVIKIVDIAHSGDVGLNQAIDMSADALSGVKLVQEKGLLTKFFDEIACDSQLFCYGVADTMKCVEMGAVLKLIVYEDLSMNRYAVYPPGGIEAGAQPTVYFLTPEQAASATFYKNAETGASNDVEEIGLVDFLANNYQKFGCTLELVTNRSQEGSQFVRGFGGIGGLLRYKVDLMHLADLEHGLKPAGPIEIEDDFM